MTSEAIAGPRYGGFGITGLGVGGVPGETCKAPEFCADHGHPGATYNPWPDVTWCLCGAVNYRGNQHQHVACCDGPLVAPNT